MSIMNMNTNSKMPLGGVKTQTVLTCPKCGKLVLVPPGLALRIPSRNAKGMCHETVDLHTGIIYRRG